MRLAGVIAAMALAATAYAQQRMENAQHGFTIEIPEGWHALPEDFLTERSRAASTPEQRVTYVAGFQEQAFENGLIFPYVLIQSIPYRDFGLDRAPAREEMRIIVSSMFNVDITATMSDEQQDLIEDTPSVTLESFDESTGQYWYDLNLTTEAAGTIRGRAHGVFGRRALLQPMFYSLEADWSIYETRAEQILQSFEFLPDYAYPDDGAARSAGLFAAKRRDGLAERAGQAIQGSASTVNWPLLLGGALVVLLILALMYAIMRRTDRR